MSGKKRLIIDTDAGIDDAQAILMAVKSPDVEVVAITTSHGNINEEQVCRNVLRLLKVVNRLDIPVYRGCDKPILRDIKTASHYHGADGFGDVPDPDAPDVTLAQPGHAVTTMIHLVNTSPGELSLVCLAPVTNIALALRMDPGFGKKLKNCFIMGGNYEGKGNTTPSAKFNFHSDPEAAKVVLGELGCPLYLACWELCLKHCLSWEWYENFTTRDTETGRFLNQLEVNTIKKYYKKRSIKVYMACDQLAMAMALDTGIIKAMSLVLCTVETSGRHSRGMMIVDWKSKFTEDGNSDSEQVDTKTEAHVITNIDHAVLEKMLMRAVE